MRNKINLAKVKAIVDTEPGSIVEVRGGLVLVVIEGVIEPMEITGREFVMAKKYIQDEIKTRPDPEDRIETWECKNKEGVYDYDVEQRLLKQRLQIKVKIDRKEKGIPWPLKRLCDKYDLDHWMGPMFLNEIALSKCEAMEDRRQSARLLGLIR